MIRRIACFLVECDTCRASLDDQTEGYTLHFDEDEQALIHLIEGGWTVTTDGHLRCADCTAEHTCDAEGHQWGPWKVCACQGSIPAHQTSGCGLFRVCHRCAIGDDTSLDRLPITGQHHRRGR